MANNDDDDMRRPIKQERLNDPEEPNENLPDSCEVGYCKPPKHSQFKKGQSGNPKGRPKKSRNAKTILTETFDELVEIKTNGKAKKLTVREIMYRAQAGKAARGDTKAFQVLEAFAVECGIGIEPATENGKSGVRIFIPHNFRDEPVGPVYREDPTKPHEEWEVIPNFKNPKKED